MLEFNSWYFVLLANFLILLAVLNSLLFQPLKKVLKEREGTINGMLNDAKAMMAKRDEALKRVSSEQAAAKAKAKETYERLRQEGLQYQKEVMGKAEAEALEMIERARKELQTECERVRAALKTDIENLSQEIMNKLVKA
jgi:F-type H+-transporting ATPase subunit b